MVHGITRQSYVTRQGHLEIREGYGLGVEADEEKFGKYRLAIERQVCESEGRSDGGILVGFAEGS